MPGADYKGGTRTTRAPDLVMRETAPDRHRVEIFFAAAECGATTLPHVPAA